ncbi:NACHT domain-containing protein [Nostoc flagelliforme FACHB-838]|uniref:NACHT domain-containing protein n=1 Tax=Nostoc flagelliforme FACHB-838 TaxID=2692904 RepID=A0ABR8DZ19_9NOSO|nr:NACHT domain-containing protein [Nostoc flagelliforme]MBD2534676.1 NACHT domain-containing protein [Nostoc flagelliforme FACHB-838]
MTETVVTQLKAIAFERDIERLTEGFTGREWVFKEIDRWLQQENERFFILTGEPGVGKSAITAHLIQTRKDIVAYHLCQAAELETLKPGRILRSLTDQLMETVPDYGLALLNTIKATLEADVKIQVKQASDSKIREVYIENLNPSDLEKEDLENVLDILIRAPLAALPKIYDERQKLAPKRAIFLIDALDVAVSTEDAAQDDEDIVTLLATLLEDESLPSWVRFILTSRPDRRVLREFEPLQSYKLEEMSQQNLADIRHYIQKRVAEPAFYNQLEAAQMSCQTLVDQLTQLSKGNFRYVRFLLDDLEAGKHLLNNLPILPESLAETYAKDLSKWFSVDELTERCQEILKVLAKAQEPLTEDQLVSLTGIRPRLVRQDLWGLRQFLDIGCIKEGEDTHETFAIFHPSLREYLLNLE